ncbi:hypothetical protein [Sulfurimonas sp. NW9]|uniref:hypothetical protein n=1 Tax=Sulfurimonas sp. NW9 TaxID=2922728 RepID=UPI003DA9E947
MESNIIAGLVSGLIVTLFIVVFKALWDSVITPWFENRVYKDIRVEGKWFSLYPASGHFRQEIIVLKRKGHDIVGTISCQNGTDEGEQYIVRGSFRNMLLPMTYESTDNAKSDRGTITLKCIKNGERLLGKIAAYDSIDDTITTTNVIWFRSKEELIKYIDTLKDKKEKIKKLRIEQKRINKEESVLENDDSEAKREKAQR